MDGFKKFLLRGNVVDLAVAVVIGAAFSRIVTAFVAAFITPLVGVVTGATGDMKDKKGRIAGVEFPYGEFLDAVLSFVLIGAIVYFLVLKPVQRLLDRLAPEPGPEVVAAATKQCPECLSSIPAAALRCAFCTVEQLDARPA